MGGRSHHVQFNAIFTPQIAPFDVYADGQAFGPVQDLSKFVPDFAWLRALAGGFNPGPTSKLSTYLEIGTIQVIDQDDQQASYDLYFRGEDFVSDTADHSPFSISPSDVPEMNGPYKLPATGHYSEVPVGGGIGAMALGKWEEGNGDKVPLTGSKLLCKVVVRAAPTFTASGNVTFKITGYIN